MSEIMCIINTRHPKEASLIQHYDQHPKYTSVFSGPDIPRVLERLCVDIEIPARFLDLGCGDGRLSIFLSQRGFAVHGVDYSRVRIGIAVREASRRKLKCSFTHMDIHHYLENCTESYDFIGCFEVLEHLEDPAVVVEKCRALLNPKGRVVGSVPLNSPYTAHIQVFDSLESVKQNLDVDTVSRYRNHALCTWRRSGQ